MSLVRSPHLKRALDVVVAGGALALLWPLLAAIALTALAAHGRPVLFRQRRPGLRGEPFTILKFRSMIVTRTGPGQSPSDEERLTAFGQLLRSTSLDELPELVNVVRGEMSLVGPRPLLMEYLPRYSSEQRRRHEVRPGITGWAQVHGRNAITWEEKFALDVWYVDHWTLWLDLRILALTLVKVLRREGISPPGQVITPMFDGAATPVRSSPPPVGGA